MVRLTYPNRFYIMYFLDRCLVNWCGVYYWSGVNWCSISWSLVFRSWGFVYRSWGLVFRSWGFVYRSWGLVFRSWGFVFRSGVVIISGSDGEESNNNDELKELKYKYVVIIQTIVTWLIKK